MSLFKSKNMKLIFSKVLVYFWMEYSNLKPIRLIIQCFNDILDIFFNFIFFSNLRVVRGFYNLDFWVSMTSHENNL